MTRNLQDTKTQTKTKWNKQQQNNTKHTLNEQFEITNNQLNGILCDYVLITRPITLKN